MGRLRARWIKPGEVVLGPLTWRPAGPGPYALLARLSAAGDDLRSPFDPAADENVAQQNLWMVSAAAGSTVEVAFDLAGVPNKTGAVSLEVDRGSLPADVVVSPASIGPALDAPGATAADNARGIVDNAVIGAVTGGLMLGLGQRRRASLAITLPGGPIVEHAMQQHSSRDKEWKRWGDSRCWWIRCKCQAAHKPMTVEAGARIGAGLATSAFVCSP